MDQLSTLWKGASYQDNLLQAYRSFNLSLQFILIAIGSGLFIATLTFEDLIKRLATYTLLIVISLLAFYLLWAMKKLIKARAEDVDYFHNAIIDYEKILPDKERVLTHFKVYQRFNRNLTDLHEYFSKFELTDSLRNQLMEKGRGHTRKLLDKYLFWAFHLVWVSIHSVTLLSFL